MGHQFLHEIDQINGVGRVCKEGSSREAEYNAHIIRSIDDRIDKEFPRFIVEDGNDKRHLPAAIPQSTDYKGSAISVKSDF